MFRFAAVLALIAAAAAQQVNVPATGSASFSSLNYPSPYPNNHRESWTVVGPAGSNLQFDSVVFDTESSYDVLEIFENGASIGRFSGGQGPQDTRTAGNTATVTFTTDSSVQRSGFQIAVKVAKCPRGFGVCPNNEDICLSPNAWCDGNQDCPDGIDEDCPDLSDCGKQTIQPTLESRGQKIVGGVEAVPHSWPWQVALLTTSNFQFCGGSIISDRWILSAAHCCAGRTPSSTLIRVGAHDLRSNSEGASNLVVDRIINHPAYSTRPATNNDFCLIRTRDRIPLGRHASPVCLANPSDSGEATGSDAYITGWGTTRSGGSSSSVLLQTRVQVDDQSSCNTAYGGVILPEMICASGPGRDTCQGDSGGPFVHQDAATGAWRLLGVTSWGRGCALPGYPGVYGRVSTAVSWITQTIVQP